MIGSESKDSDQSALRGVWPTPVQELLLHACFSSEEDALAAYLEWDACEGLVHITSQSYLFLPLLYRNLSGRLKRQQARVVEGTYRKTWYQNQHLLKDHADLLNRFVLAGIDTIQLEGLPLSARYYRDLGVRPFGSLHVLVRGDDLEAARFLLKALEYDLTSWQPPVEGADFLRFRGSALYQARNGRRLELHWRVIKPGTDAWDERFWKSSEPFQVQTLHGRALCAADELYLACIRELSWAYRPRHLWIADALAILQSEQTIDWPHLCDLARETGYIVPIRAALHYLVQTFAAPVPAFVLAELDMHLGTLSDRLLHRRLGTSSAHSLLTDVGSMLAQNYRTLGEESVLQSILKLPRFLQYQWMLSKPIQLPGHALRRLRQRLSGHSSN